MEKYGNGLGYAGLFIMLVLLLVGGLFLNDFDPEKGIKENNNTSISKEIKTSTNVIKTKKIKKARSYEEAFSRTFNKN